MSDINAIFVMIEKLTQEDGQREFISVITEPQQNENQSESELHNNRFQQKKNFLLKIITEIDKLATEIQNDEKILISVKNQKLLRTCFQIITSLGISPCLIPGLGISLTKRCISASFMLPFTLTDEQKYEMIVICTDFFTRSYKIPVLKNIIVTLHLSDYLASLIQLAFAPLKKPGTYNNFVMTEELYDKLSAERQKYVEVYKQLVSNCFQPTLMKELLVLQSVSDPPPPTFVKRIIAKEMSQRLLAPGGLLSLIRCFIESYNVDTGYEWKKIDMICKIVATKHGNTTEDIYLRNICYQLMQILSLNNTHYLATAVACVLNLNEKYPESQPVKIIIKEIFQAFDYENLLSKCNLPGTLILSSQEIEHKVNILYACTTKLSWPQALLMPNLYILFLMGLKCTNSEELRMKLRDIVLKCLEQLKKTEMSSVIKMLLFGKGDTKLPAVAIEEYEAGLSIKCVSTPTEHPKGDTLLYFLNIIKSSTSNVFVQNVFEISLLILIDLNVKRQKKIEKEVLLTSEEEPTIIDDVDEQYANILQMLSELATSQKVIMSLKTNPYIVLNFIEHFILKRNKNSDEECTTIALVLLNTILSNSVLTEDLEKRFNKLTPVLKKMADDESSFNNILCKEALKIISSEEPQQADTACEKAIHDVFDELLPVRAHGIIELTKLIDSKDPETISKKHYIFCLFQEQLKNTDSYIYLSAVNGIAALGTYCTEDVFHVLCKEFLQVSTEQSLETSDGQNKISELRMKVGDIIVKVTRRLGEMAIVHKTLLLNTILCGCRDEDPLIRTSALSNLSEIALVLHYKVGSIIYEVLLCIWSIIETDKAVECRRAAVMVISSLLKGLGKENLIQLKENLLPIYRTLKKLYSDSNEDNTVRLHAQIAIEELNEIVNELLFSDLKMEKQIFVLDKPEDVFK